MASLKCILLHNAKNASVPISHSVHLKEGYKNTEILLSRCNYSGHTWCLEVLRMLLARG